MKILTKIILLLFLATADIFSQFSEVQIGGGFGIGSIAGNSPSQSAYSNSIFIGAKHSFTGDIIFRLNYIYASKINSILPEDRTNRYYPFQHIFSATAALDQKLSSVYLQGGIGPLLIQDRIFNDENSLDFGLIVYAGVYFNLFTFTESSIDLGLTGNFGETFTNTLASFNLYQINLVYFP
ncbi:MAG: hypothetical protein Fur0015_12400 [Ignavibacteriales bacterium]